MPAQPIRPLGQVANRSATNEMGRVLPVFYGRQRIGGQFISDFFDIKAVAQSSGGKGGATTGANYYASFAVMVGHGPATKFCDLYLNGDSVYTALTPLYAVSLSQTGNVATFQTKNPHGLPTGATVSVYYAFQPEFNGQFVITVPADKPTQFQYIIPGTSIAAETATPQSGQSIYALVALPPVDLTADLTNLTIPDFGTSDIMRGSETQPQNAYLSGVSGIQHPNYCGQIYIVFHQIFLGFNQTNAQNVEVVMERIPTFDWMSNTAHALVDSVYGTCNPAVIIADLLLNKRFGLGVNEDDLNIASFDAGVEYFFSAGIGFSPLWDRAEEIRAQIQAVLENVDATLIPDDDGKLMLVIAQPPVAPPTVTEDNLSDLPNFPGDDWSGVINRTSITFVDSDAGWAKDFVSWADMAAIYGKGRIEPQTLDRSSLINNRGLAQKIAAVFGPISSLPKKTGTVSLIYDDELFAALAPGNAFQFNYDLNPDLNAIYRVVSRSIADPEKPVFEIEVSIDRSYLYAAAPVYIVGNTVTTGGKIVSKKIISAPVVPDLQPIPAPSPSAIVELPACLCPNNKPAIAALVTRNTVSDTVAQLYLGRNYVFSGTAPASFFLFAIVTGFAFHGALAADFAAATAFASIANALPAEAQPIPFPLVNGLTLQLDGLDLILPDVNDFDALANSLLLFVGNEIMSIAEATMNASGNYTLTVIRGRFGTPIEDHANGAVVWIISLTDLKPLQHPHFLAGNDAQFTLTIGSEPLSDADAFDIVFIGNRWNFPEFFNRGASGSWPASGDLPASD